MSVDVNAFIGELEDRLDKATGDTSKTLNDLNIEFNKHVHILEDLINAEFAKTDFDSLDEDEKDEVSDEIRYMILNYIPADHISNMTYEYGDWSLGDKVEFWIPSNC